MFAYMYKSTYHCIKKYLYIMTIKIKYLSMLTEIVESAMDKKLAEAGIKSDMVSLSKAYSLLSKHLINKGISEGHIKCTPKTAVNSKQLISLQDITNYKIKLVNEGTIRLM